MVELVVVTESSQADKLDKLRATHEKPIHVLSKRQVIYALFSDSRACQKPRAETRGLSACPPHSLAPNLDDRRSTRKSERDPSRSGSLYQNSIASERITWILACQSHRAGTSSIEKCHRESEGRRNLR